MPKRYGRIVTPIYKQVGVDGQAIDHHGSGVLIKTTDRFWLFTAAHLLDGNRALFLLGSKQVVVYADRFFICREPLDLAFTELVLTDARALEAKGLNFLSVENIDGSAEPTSATECIFLGYPHRSVEVNGDDRTTFAVTTMLTSRFLAEHELRQAHVDPRFQVAAIFDGFGTPDGKAIKGFDPHGLSGGAIMCVRSADDVKLLGIATDHDPRLKMLIGTRLRPLLEEMLNLLNGEALADSRPHLLNEK